MSYMKFESIYTEDTIEMSNLIKMIILESAPLLKFEDDFYYKKDNYKILQLLEENTPGLPPPNRPRLPAPVPKNPIPDIPDIKNDPEVLKEKSLLVGKLIVAILLMGLNEWFYKPQLDSFVINVMTENENNKAMFQDICSKINRVYREHPDYTPMTPEQFQKTGIFNYMKGYFRDKNAKEVARLLGHMSIDNILEIIIQDGVVPWPGSMLFSPLVRFILYYCGVDIGLTDPINMPTYVNGNIVIFHINYRPLRFVITDLTMFCNKDKNKMVRVKLEPPPEKLYKVTTDHVKKAFDKVGKGDQKSNMKEFRKEMRKLYVANSK